MLLEYSVVMYFGYWIAKHPVCGITGVLCRGGVVAKALSGILGSTDFIPESHKNAKTCDGCSDQKLE